MKQQKLIGYQPNYPRKALRGAALTAAALVAIGGAAGCRHANVRIDGMLPVATPTEETLVLDGEVAIPEPVEEATTTGMIDVQNP